MPPLKRLSAVRKIGVFCALVLASCFGDSFGPGELRPGRISLIPSFDQQASNLVDFDQVHIVLSRPGNNVQVLDTVITFPVGVDSVILSFTVGLTGASEQLTLVMELIDQPSGNVVFTVGPTTVTATAGGGGTAQQLPPFIYVGPGANAAGVRFVTTASEVFFQDSVALTAEAFDGQGATMTGVPIRWTSSDTSRAILRTDSTGRVVARSVRGPVTIRASLLRTSPTTAPPAVNQPVVVQPRPNTIAVQSGNAQTGAVGAALPLMVTARVLATDNLGVQGVVVTFAVATGGGSLAALVDTTDANGDARTTWTLGTVLGAQSVTASVPGVAGATVNFGATGSPAAPAQLEFLVQPANASQGAVITPPITVRAVDQFGNPNTSFTGMVVVNLVTNPSAATMIGTTTRAAVAGVASFNDLSINNVGIGYQLGATSGALVPDTSATFDIAPNAPTQLTFDVQPTNALAGQAIAPAVQVALRNSGGAIVTASTAAVTLAIGNNPGGAVLGGTTTVNAVAGVATFTGLTLDRSGTGYTLAATSGAIPATASASFDIAAGPAAALIFSTQPPASTIFQSPFGTAVTARDANGNVATTYSGQVTLAIGSNPAGGTLFGTASVFAVAGVATFSGVSIDNIGAGYTLTANATGLAGVASGSLNVIAPANVNAWINPAGGNWSTASNWSRGTVPNATDTVFIRQSGTYTVNLDVSATLARLDVGAPLGVQTLSVAANTLTMAGNGAFTVNGRLIMSGGTITGAGVVDIFGVMDWQGGDLSGGNGMIRLQPGLQHLISTTATRTLNSYTLENRGAAFVTHDIVINSGSGGTIRNAAGATFDMQSGGVFLYNQGGAASVFDNQGTFTSYPGTGQTTISAQFNNSGSAVTQTGFTQLSGGGTGSGSFTAGAGTVLIFGGGTHTLTATSSVGGPGEVRISTGAIVNAAGGWAVTSPTRVNGGTFNYNNATGGTTGTLIVSSGTLGGTGLLQVSGAMTWSGGNLSTGGGTTRVLAGGTLAVTGSASGRQLNNYTLELAGTGTWATTTATMNSGSGGTLRVLAGGQLDVTGDFGISYNQGGAVSRLVVQAGGTLSRGTSANPVQFTTVVDDSGTVNVQTGTLDLSGGGTTSGTLSVSSGATLEFGGGTHTVAGAGAITGAGTVLASAGTLNVSGGYVASTTRIAGGTANFNFPGLTTTTLDITSGTLGGSPGNGLNVSGAMTWSGGNLTGTGGATRVLSGGTLAVTGSGSGRQINNYTLELAGTGTWATTTAIMNSGSGGTLRVLAGGQLDVTGDFGISYNQGGAVSRLVVLGTLRRTTSTGVVQFTMASDDSGTVNIQTGTLDLSGGGTSSGAFTAAGGATLEFGAGTHNLGPASTVGGLGMVLVSGGTVNAGGNWAHGGTTQISGGTLNYGAAGGSTVNLDVTSGTLGGTAPGLLSVSGAMTWSGGNLSTGGGTTRVLATGTLAVSGSGSGRQINNYTLELAGTGTWATTTAIMNSGSGGTLRVLAGGQLDVTGDFGISYNQGGAVSRLVVLGTLRRTTSTGAVQFTMAADDSGAVDVQTGTLDLSGGGSSSGTFSVSSGATLEFGGGTHALGAVSSLSGAGSAQISGGTVNAAGAWSVTGTTRVNGGAFNYDGASGTTAAFDISAGTHGGTGMFSASGAMTWSGGDIAGGNGTTRVLSGGTLAITGTGSRTFSARVLENAGSATWSGTLTLNSGSGAVMRNTATGTFTLSGDGAFTFNQGGAASVFDNQGAFVRNTSAGTATWSADFNHTGGTLTISTGVFSLTGGGLMSAPVTVTSGAFLDFTASTWTLNNGFNATGTGAVRVQGGTIVNSTVADTARFQNLDLNTGSLNHVGGVVVSGTGAVLNWTSTAGIIGTGTTRVANTATMNVTGIGVRTFTNGTILNQGQTSWSGTLTINTGVGAVWRNAAGAAFTLSGDGAFTNNQGGTQAVFQNWGGAFTRNTSAGTATWSAFFSDSVGGNFNINTGTFQLTGGGRFAGGTRFVNGTATLEFAAGTVSGRVGGSIAGTGRVLLSGATFSTDSTGPGTPYFLENVDFTAGSIAHEGFITATGILNWTGGTFSSNTVGLGGTTTISSAITGLLTVSGAAAHTITGVHVLRVGGGATLAYTGNTPISVGQGMSVVVQSGGLFDIQGDGILDHNLGGTATFDLQASGTLRRSVSAGVATLEPVINKLGIIDVQTGTLLMLGGSVTNLAGTHTGAGTVDLGGGTFTTTGNFTVPGNLTVSAGALTFAGAARTITVTGNFSTTGTGVLNMTTATDVLDVNGDASFGGGAGTLSNGVIRVAGNFTQVGAGASFAPGPNTSLQQVLLDGAGAQSLSFGTTANSFFRRLEINKAGGAVTLASNVRASRFRMVSGTTLGGVFRLITDTVTSANFAHTINPLAVEISAVLGDSGGTGFTPDTTVFTGTGQSISLNNTTFQNYAYNSIRVAQSAGAASIATAVFSIPQDLVVSSGTLVINSARVAVNGNFRTEGTGTLQMTSVAESLGVALNASFAGGSTTGLLTAGKITANGDFSQAGTATAFNPSGTHHTSLRGSGTQNISFGSPTSSRFHRLEVQGFGGASRNVVLQTNVTVGDSLILPSGGTAGAHLIGAGTTQRLDVGGIVSMSAGTTSPRLAPPVLLLAVAPVIAVMPAGKGMEPDTTVFQGAIAALPVGGGIHYNHIRVNTLGNFAMANDTIAGDLDIVGTGTNVLFTGTNTFVIGGQLRTRSSAVYAQTGAGTRVTVLGDASFAGGTSTNINNGILELRGNFTQGPTGSTNAFQASGAHTTLLSYGPGALRRTVSLANPGTTAADSRFARLQIGRTIGAVSQPVSLELLTNVQAAFAFDTSTGATIDTIFTTGGNAAILTTDTLQVSNTSFTTTRVIMGNATTGGTFAHQTIGVVFSSMNTAQTFATIHRSVAAPAVQLASINFSSTPAGAGRYFVANTTAAGGGSAITLQASNVIGAVGCPFVTRTGPTPPSFTWIALPCP